MKRILLFVAASSMATFVGVQAQAPQFDFSITTPTVCTQGQPTTLSVVMPTPGLIYTWQQYKQATWNFIADSVDEITVIDTGAYRAIAWPDGHFKKSNTITLCHCTVLPLKVSSFTGVVLESGTLLTFVVENVNAYTKVLFEISTDGRSWRTLADVKYVSAYRAPTIVVPTWYRLKAVRPDGSYSISDVKVLSPEVNGKINLAKPFTVSIIEYATGRVMSSIEGLTSAYATTLLFAYKHPFKTSPALAMYVFKFEQRGVFEARIVVR